MQIEEMEEMKERAAAARMKKKDSNVASKEMNQEAKEMNQEDSFFGYRLFEGSPFFEEDTALEIAFPNEIREINGSSEIEQQSPLRSLVDKHWRIRQVETKFDASSMNLVRNDQPTPDPASKCFSCN